MIVPKVNSKDVDVTGILYLLASKGFPCIKEPLIICYQNVYDF